MSQETVEIEVVCGVLMKGRSILLARRRKEKSLAGFWEFPGGKIEEGETPEQALERELKEEFGISCQIGDFIGKNSQDYDFGRVNLQAYWVRIGTEKMRLSDHDRVEWVHPEDIAEFRLAPADIPLIPFIRDTHSQQLNLDALVN